MNRILSDSEINRLIIEQKLAPKNWKKHLQLKSKNNTRHEEGRFTARGKNGNNFRVIIRRNKINRLDFSIILKFIDNDGKEYFIVRYNGKHPSEHTNRWEKLNSFVKYKFESCFHIHKATQRYQESGLEIAGYAEETELYSDYQSALNTFIKDVNIVEAPKSQYELFISGG